MKLIFEVCHVPIKWSYHSNHVSSAIRSRETKRWLPPTNKKFYRKLSRNVEMDLASVCLLSRNDEKVKIFAACPQSITRGNIGEQAFIAVISANVFAI